MNKTEFIKCVNGGLGLLHRRQRDGSLTEDEEKALAEIASRLWSVDGDQFLRYLYEERSVIISQLSR